MGMMIRRRTCVCVCVCASRLSRRSTRIQTGERTRAEGARERGADLPELVSALHDHVVALGRDLELVLDPLLKTRHALVTHHSMTDTAQRDDVPCSRVRLLCRKHTPLRGSLALTGRRTANQCRRPAPRRDCIMHGCWNDVPASAKSMRRRMEEGRGRKTGGKLGRE